MLNDLLKSDVAYYLGKLKQNKVYLFAVEN